jgi:hypothetical protein
MWAPVAAKNEFPSRPSERSGHPIEPNGNCD